MRMLYRVGILVVTRLIFWPCILSAQILTQGQQVTVEADHDGVNTTEYHLLENSTVKATLPVTSLQNNMIRFPYIIPARGSWVITVEACNEDGCSISDPTNFTSGKPKPNKPGKPRIISALTSMFTKDNPVKLAVKFSE